jgi:crotonobetainyl-CoA:carnitine CoA-transferase CaiB-like acyl-CoA transferase
MSKKRNKGAVYLDLNRYGKDGYYAERPGFQQIADAATGCSYVCGKSLGFEEGTGVLPSLPIPDMLSGAVAVLDIILALRHRAKHGASYHAFAALVAVDAFQLTEDVGLYSQETVDEIQSTFKETPFGKSHAILDPIVKYGNADCNPRWDHGPVPYCYSST